MMGGQARRLCYLNVDFLPPTHTIHAVTYAPHPLPPAISVDAHRFSRFGPIYSRFVPCDVCLCRNECEETILSTSCSSWTVFWDSIEAQNMLIIIALMVMMLKTRSNASKRARMAGMTLPAVVLQIIALSAPAVQEHRSIPCHCT